MVEPNYKESVSFLQRWCENGPWILTAITLDKKSIVTSTFTEPDAVMEWLEEHGATKNIYFSVNKCRYSVSKKPSREDIESMDWCHLDLDPRAGENIDAERKRIIHSLQNPPAGIPHPTVILFSGGGFQAMWKLSEAIPIQGREIAYEDAKRYNIALELAFSGDQTHNLDRIFRLVGTINRPDARKLSKGRVPTLAKLIEFNDNVYPITAFTKSVPVQDKASGFGSANTKIKLSGDIKRIDDINSLGDKVSDNIKVLIVQGILPDSPNKYPSRSEALFAVCCSLVRADLTNDEIYAVISDPGFAISASVLDKGTGMESYCARQIERAREFAIDPHLAKLNDRYAVVTMGGKERVIDEQDDPTLHRHTLVIRTFEDFQKKYMNRTVKCGVDAKGNDRFVPLGKFWLNHKDRRQFNTVIFSPEVEAPDAYNMWRGFNCEAKPGTNHEVFLGHIYKNVCDEKNDLYDYVIGWMALAVQKPGRPGETAIVLRGEQGTGKGFLARTFGHLFGRHFLHISNAAHLIGNFNVHLQDCLVLFADEAFYAGDKKHTGILKTLVTERSIMITPKGIDSEMKANCLHIIMASNEDWVVPAGPVERRFAVLDVGQAHIQDTKYFGEIADKMRDGGYENLLHYLLTYDLTGFEVRNLPKTQALNDQKVHSLDPMEGWWYYKLEEGKLLVEHEGWQRTVLCEELIQDYVEYGKTFNIQAKRGTPTALGRFLKDRVCPGILKRQGAGTVTIGDRVVHRPYYYTFPSLDELREWWDEKFGGTHKWPEIKQMPGEKKKEENLPF